MSHEDHQGHIHKTATNRNLTDSDIENQNVVKMTDLTATWNLGSGFAVHNITSKVARDFPK